jgi:syntaxin 5
MDLNYSRQSQEAGRIIIEMTQRKRFNHLSTFKQFLVHRAESLKTREKRRGNAPFFNQLRVNTSVGFSNGSSQRESKKKPLFKQRQANFDLESGTGEITSSRDEEIQMLNLEKNGRQQSLTKIQEILTDIGGIYQRLGTMVQMHDVMIDRIDKDTDDSMHNVEKGKKTLLEVYTSVSSKRRLIIKIFLVLLCFSLLYVLFLA